MINAVLIAGLLFVQAAPPSVAIAASAQASGREVAGGTVTRRQPGSDADPKDVICHDEALVGSRLSKRVCAIREELAQRRREDQQQLREWVAVSPLKAN